MLNGYVKTQLAGSGSVVWKGREMYAAGEINKDEFMEYVASGYVESRLPGLYIGSILTCIALHR